MFPWSSGTAHIVVYANTDEDELYCGLAAYVHSLYPDDEDDNTALPSALVSVTVFSFYWFQN